MHKKLFIPGPTEVAPEVLQKLATPMIGHRTKDASNLQREISGLQVGDVFNRHIVTHISPPKHEGWTLFVTWEDDSGSVFYPNDELLVNRQMTVIEGE